MDNLTQIVEAILFASGSSRRKSDIISLLKDVTISEFDIAIAELVEKYSKDSGIVLLDFNGKIQLSTNPIYGETVAEVLTPLKEKELSRVLLEVLAIIAYKQPITRLEIEKIKSSSAEYALSVLLKVHLIEVVGRKDAVGKPVLYGTTDEFLKKFQLENISQLPDYNSVLDKLESLGSFNKSQADLYRQIDIDSSNWQYDETVINKQERLNEIDKSLADSDIIDEIMNNDELPDFLIDEDFKIIE